MKPNPSDSTVSSSSGNQAGVALNGSDETSEVGCCDTSIHIANEATVNIYPCQRCLNKPKTPEAEPTDLYPLEPSLTESCVPLTLGHKPKKSLEDRLQPLLDEAEVPSALPAAFFQMARRFLAGRVPSNDLESNAFAVFEGMSPEVTEVMACALSTFDALPAGDRDHLFTPGLLGTPDQPVEPEQLAEFVASELLTRTSLEAFGDENCIETERPGQVRGVETGDDVVPFRVNVNICRINGLRTSSFSPALSLAEYTSEELQQVCTPEIVDDEVQLNCEVQTEPCPGHDVEGTCLRVPEINPGSGVMLEGVNFFDTQTRVRLESQGETTTVREVEVHVCGDTETPVTEEVDGQERTIRDCRVRDRLSFRVPDDLPDGRYALTVIVPNNVGVHGHSDEFEFESAPQFIRVVPSNTVTFQIASEQLDCVLETAAPVFRNAGSDEIGIKAIAIPIGPDLVPGEAVEQNFKFGDVDTGEERAMDRVLFQGSNIGGVSVSLIGFEIDNQDAFEQQVRDFADAFVLVTTSSWEAVAATVGALGGSTALALGLSASWAAAIAAGIALAIHLFVALWAPADLVIEDAAAFTPLTLGELTSPNFPPPSEQVFTSAGDIDVRILPVSKGVQYVERREYRSDSEDSEYHVTLRYNRF